jgi:hypothetical protein
MQQDRREREPPREDSEGASRLQQLAHKGANMDAVRRSQLLMVLLVYEGEASGCE